MRPAETEIRPMVWELMLAPTRNDPCPCGSGSKYKRCCLNQQRFRDMFEETLSGVTYSTRVSRMLTESPTEISCLDRLTELLPIASVKALCPPENQDRFYLDPDTVPAQALTLASESVMFVRFSVDLSLGSEELLLEILDEKYFLTENERWLTGALVNPYALGGIEIFPITLVHPGAEIVNRPVAFTDAQTSAPVGALHWRVGEKLTQLCDELYCGLSNSEEDAVDDFAEDAVDDFAEDAVDDFEEDAMLAAATVTALLTGILKPSELCAWDEPIGQAQPGTVAHLAPQQIEYFANTYGALSTERDSDPEMMRLIQEAKDSVSVPLGAWT